MTLFQQGIISTRTKRDRVDVNVEYSSIPLPSSRHITFCTTSLLEKNKCEWLSEAGSVYGIAPSIQCAMRNDTEACIEAVANGECHVVQADSNWLMKAERYVSLVNISKLEAIQYKIMFSP